VLHPAIARMMLQEIRRPPEARRAGPVDPLSERELEVLRLLARGMSNQEIADTLVVGEATVRSHVSAILRKLQLASRTQAALYALREGLASLDETSHGPEYRARSQTGSTAENLAGELGPAPRRMQMRRPP
jgi:NarL family two-component system response regulator LiaR